MKRRKFKLGQWLLIPINGEYKIKFLSNILFDDNCVSLYFVNYICKNKEIYKWKPTKNEKCLFIDFLGNSFIDEFIGMDYENYYYKSKNSLRVENYCPCCAEKDPYININTFEICEPYFGQKTSYYERFKSII